MSDQEQEEVVDIPEEDEEDDAEAPDAEDQEDVDGKGGLTTHPCTSCFSHLPCVAHCREILRLCS